MEHLKEFNKAFDKLSHGHNRGRLFADFVEIAALTVHQAPYHGGVLPRDEAFERIETLYLDAIKRYDKEEIGQIVTLYATASMGLIENRADFLGAAYMGLEISNDRSGQFFTPPTVQRMMAEMSLHDVGKVIEEKGYFTISEPAAGAGGMLIEAANVVKAQGHDPTKTMWFQAVDVDRTCFNMAYFQLSTLGLCGEVVHGNTLSMEQWDSRFTPQMVIINALAPAHGSMDAPPPPAPIHIPEPAMATAAAPVASREPERSPAKTAPQLEMDFGYDPGRYVRPMPRKGKDKDREIER